MQNYKDLRVWEKAHKFTLDIYLNTKNFPKEEVYGLTNQIRRCSSSIPANIAEGCGKNSNLELANFLNISLGSANEAEYFLILSRDLQYFSIAVFDIMFLQINEIKAMLINLINKIRNSET